MRLPFALVSFALCAGCTTTFAEPRLLVSPYLAVYRLRGDSAVQTSTGQSTPPQDNPAQSMRAFGLNRYDDDLGIRADFGDGFAGLRLDYLHLDQSTSKSGTIDGGWGNLQAGDTTTMNPRMDELRLAWLEPVWSTRTVWRDKPLHVKVAAGGALTHRDMSLRARALDAPRAQTIASSGDTAAVAARFRVSWRDTSFDLDYALSPDLALGGDFGGVQQDVEARLGYTLPMQDVTFFAGYRYSRLHTSGTHDNVGYSADLVLDGWQFGITVTF
jgi:hypothetical protein